MIGSVQLRSVLKHEAAGGVALVAAAALALLISNSPLSSLYDALLDTPVSVRIGGLGLDKPLLLWINDGLMAIFFCLVGLEIKRELLTGALSDRNSALLPLIGAIGGMAVPALIYALINIGNPDGLRGWAVPAATDIAFSLGVLALLGSRVPTSLNTFLLALAIIDDLGAILIIAVFYTADLSMTALALASAGAAALLILNRLHVSRLTPYLVIGGFIWVCVLKSGVHATLAGVLVGMAIPYQTRLEKDAPLLRLEHSLQPWVALAILPMFGFANAGIPLSGVSMASLLQPIPLGIALGLFVGKQAGILGAVYAAVRSGLCEKPAGSSWAQVWGVSIIAGIGFTMSLFFGTLAFPDAATTNAVRLGVGVGSLASVLTGSLVLLLASRVLPTPHVPPAV